MKLPLLLLAALLIYSCASENKKEGESKGTATEQSALDSLLVTETSWGAIQKTTDIEGLKTIYGSLLADSSIPGPEGIDTLLVTYIFPGTEKEFIVHWRDSLHHQSIGFIETYQPRSPYRTVSGIRIGSTLRDLLGVNQQPIHFMGFGWDYGGYIMSYNKGRLDSSQINFRLEGNENLPQGLYGDNEFHTGLPLVRDNLDHIRVYSLMLSFYEQ